MSYNHNTEKLTQEPEKSAEILVSKASSPCASQHLPTLGERVEAIKSRFTATKQFVNAEEVFDLVPLLAECSVAECRKAVTKLCRAANIPDIDLHQKINITRAALAESRSQAAALLYLPAGMELPDGFELTDTGVWSVRGESRQLAVHTPLWIQRLSNDPLDEHQLHAVIAWRSYDNAGDLINRELSLPLGQILGKGGLQPLLSAGAPIMADAAYAAAAYIVAFYAKNAQLLMKQKVTRVYHPDYIVDGSGYIAGPAAAYGTAKGYEFVPTKRIHCSNYFLSKGTAAEWITSFKPFIEKSPMLAFGLAVACSSVLLHLSLLDRNGFSFNYYTRSSRGKTVGLMLLASIFGKPGGKLGSGLIHNGNATGTYLEKSAAFLRCCTLFGQDAHRIEPKDLVRFLYDLANGAGRGRGSVNGDQQELAVLKSVAIFDSEWSIIEKVNAEGAQARGIFYPGRLTDDFNGKEDGDAMLELLDEQYGTIGPLLYEKAAELADRLKPLYKQFRSQYTKYATSDVENRAADNFALVHTAGYFLSQIDGMDWILPLVENTCAEVWTVNAKIFAENSPANRGLDAVRGYVDQFLHTFDTDSAGTVNGNIVSGLATGRYDRPDPGKGKRGRIFIYREKVDELLKKANVPDSVRSAWVDMGVLAHSSKSTVAHIRGTRATVVAFWEDALFPPITEETDAGAVSETVVTKAVALTEPVPSSEIFVQAQVLKVGSRSVQVKETQTDQLLDIQADPVTFGLYRSTLSTAMSTGSELTLGYFNAEDSSHVLNRVYAQA